MAVAFGWQSDCEEQDAGGNRNENQLRGRLSEAPDSGRVGWSDIIAPNHAW